MRFKKLRRDVPIETAGWSVSFFQESIPCLRSTQTNPNQGRSNRNGKSERTTVVLGCLAGIGTARNADALTTMIRKISVEDRADTVDGCTRRSRMSDDRVLGYVPTGLDLRTERFSTIDGRDFTDLPLKYWPDSLREEELNRQLRSSDDAEDGRSTEDGSWEGTPEEGCEDPF